MKTQVKQSLSGKKAREAFALLYYTHMVNSWGFPGKNTLEKWYDILQLQIYQVECLWNLAFVRHHIDGPWVYTGIVMTTVMMADGL